MPRIDLSCTLAQSCSAIGTSTFEHAYTLVYLAPSCDCLVWRRLVVRVQLVLGCPGHHDLEKVTAPHGRFTCGGCKTAIKYRSKIVVCGTCDVQYCLQCAKPGAARAQSLSPPAKRAKTSGSVDGGDAVTGCPWTGKMSERSAHARDCTFEETTCGLEGCAEKVLRLDLAAHESQCGYSHVPCSDCKEKLPSRELESHTKTCGMAVVACSNGHRAPGHTPCGWKKRRKHMEAHAKVCPLAPVECPFAPYGCEEHLRREDYVRSYRHALCPFHRER